MAEYQGLPQVYNTAAKDTTGRNTGNVSNVLASGGSAGLPYCPQFEVYHMTVTGGVILASATILLRNYTFSTVSLDLSGANEWDPQQPMLVNSGDEIDFLWNIAATAGTNPVVTLWLRYDVLLPRNQSYRPGSLWAGVKR